MSSFHRSAPAMLAAACMLLAGTPIAHAAPPTRGAPPTAPTAPTGPAQPPGTEPGDDAPTSPPTAVPGRPGTTAPRPTGPAGPAAPRTNPELSGDEGGAAAGGAHNTCKRQPRGARFRITLPKEATLEDLVNWMMTISCQKFIWDPKIRSGNVTILSPEPVTVEEAYAAFYASLNTMGLTVEPSGEYFKIVESLDAKSRTLPVYGPEGRAPNNDRYVTQLLRVQSGNTKDIVDLLNKLKSKQGSVDQVGDLVIVTDTGASVRRMMQIVRQVDDPAVAGEKIFFFQLQYADPEETANTIREIFGEGAAAGGGQAQAAGRRRGGAQAAGAPDGGGGSEAGFSRVVVDERTGTLIIVAQEGDYQVIRRLIEQLDVPLAGGGGRIHVVKLKNADPEKVATVLTQLGSGAQQAGAGGGAAGRRGGQQGNQPAGGNPASPQSAELFSGEIKVTADPDTRSLVILASNNDFKALRSVIDELDAERRQVYIEVYLLELSMNKTWNFGAGGHFGSNFDTSGGPGLGFVSSAPNPDQSSILLSPSLLTGLAAGVIGPQVPNSAALLGTQRDIPAFGVVIQALQENNDINFVAEPHLYTADNQEAAIEVGRNVPTPGALSFPGGGQGGGLVPVQSIQRQDVTLNVKVTPHVNDQSTVTLDIEMENNDIESISETLGVTTTKRRLKLDQVVARNDQPVVLGGLMQEVERENVQQVPGLGSIPLLGWLFKSKRKERVKVNLLMILVPHILETPDDVRRIHERRMKERLEFLERYTAFKRRDLDINVNYRKKAGLLSALNAESGRMVSDEEFRRAAEAEMQQQVITGEIGLSPQLYEEESSPEEPQAPNNPPGSAAPPPSSAPARPRRPG